MKKLWLFIALASMAIVFYVVVYWWRFTSAWQPVVNQVEIAIKALNESVYIKKKLWGISYDHKVIWISSTASNKLEYNSKTDYIYKGMSSLFYVVKNEVLEIYVSKASTIPPEFNSEVKIIQIEYDNPTMMELLTTYESKGLMKFE